LLNKSPSTFHTAHLAYALFNTSFTIAKMVDRGLLAHIGAHGEPPLGFNYHAELFFTRQGGLSNYEVNLLFVASWCQMLMSCRNA
jgi:hypothetical protein